MRKIFSAIWETIKFVFGFALFGLLIYVPISILNWLGILNLKLSDVYTIILGIGIIFGIAVLIYAIVKAVRDEKNKDGM